MVEEVMSLILTSPYVKCFDIAGFAFDSEMNVRVDRVMPRQQVQDKKCAEKTSGWSAYCKNHAVVFKSDTFVLIAENTKCNKIAFLPSLGALFLNLKKKPEEYFYS